MRGWQSIIAIFVIGITFSGIGTLLPNGQEESKNTNAQDEINIWSLENTTAQAVAQAQIQAEVQEQNQADGNSESPRIVSSKAIEDFPGPIRGEPLRVAGEYYSEDLETMLFHPGTDYAQAEGAVIRVKHEGRVTYAGSDPFLGNKVEVDCGEDWHVVYGGLKNLRVKEGDWLEVDEAIGQIGYYPDIYGDIEQPHLHYEVWQGDLVQVPKI